MILVSRCISIIIDFKDNKVYKLRYNLGGLDMS